MAHATFIYKSTTAEGFEFSFIDLGLGTNLFVKVPRPGDLKGH